jgi:regulatory protein
MLLAQLERWCAYRDRSELEARRKYRSLADKEEPGATEDWIIERLREESFLDDERFARSYALGKFRNNHWGRLLIRQGLRQAGIGEETIAEALESIGEAEYEASLKTLLEKKLRSMKGQDSAREKAARFALSKGYESALVWELLKKA